MLEIDARRKTKGDRSVASEGPFAWARRLGGRDRAARAVAACFVAGMLGAGDPAAGDPAAGDPAAGDSVAGDDGGPNVSESTAEQESTATADVSGETSPCTAVRPGEVWVDRMQGRVMESLCGASRWFDGYFGEPRSAGEYHTSFGRLGLAVTYDEVDEVDLDTLFKARIQLPNLERKVSAFVGRYEKDDFVRDRDQDERRITSLPEVFSDTEDDEWLAGLGYSPPGTRRSRLDLDAGVRLASPLDPFVKGRWRFTEILGDRTVVRLGQTVFWRNKLGAGATSHASLERKVFDRPNLLLRWSAGGTAAEEIQGIDWYTAVTLYQRVGEIGALAWTADWNGETDAPVTVWEAGLGVVFRHRFHRDWLFLEYRMRSRWVREERNEPRVQSFGAAFGFEMLFGRDIRDPAASGP